MREVIEFLAACWSTGMLLRSVCALVIVPALAWLALRAIAPHLSRLDSDPEWQAPLAAAAAAIPGALFVLLAVEAMIGGLAAACLETLVGRVLFALSFSSAFLPSAGPWCLAAVEGVRRLHSFDGRMRPKVVWRP